jgi:hypothetical protein
MKTIETVKEYNARQTGSNMMFLNANGTKTKRGYVVTINDIAKLYKTLEECEQVTENDYVKKETLPCYKSGGQFAIITEINN